MFQSLSLRCILENVHIAAYMILRHYILQNASMVDMARIVPQIVEPVSIMFLAILWMENVLIVRLDILRTIVTRVSSNIKVL